ncbi:unnamed protein product [Cyprideis torosa]|uniref:Uncharacterized protein n=1 Tax=Cyprideis torosa TaxID=163714 RepID=A0A7R8W1K0_9CRUS|nr:unnamed protein product [Cyprideis torosa]CAG0879899.1 unnamed protein product [Cyprideis torosa]
MIVDPQICERLTRSVYVGNLPFEASDAQVREIFSQCGHVLSVRRMMEPHLRGVPKLYGFVEYRDADTANTCVRVLNGFELGGRTLRVDTACYPKYLLECQNMSPGPMTQPAFSEEADPDAVPAIIFDVVNSLCPEESYNVLKETQTAIKADPAAARSFLLQYPQVAFALLQLQTNLGIISKDKAMKMLHADEDQGPDDVEPPARQVGPRPPVAHPQAAPFGPSVHGPRIPVPNVSDSLLPMTGSGAEFGFPRPGPSGGRTGGLLGDGPVERLPSRLPPPKVPAPMRSRDPRLQDHATGSRSPADVGFNGPPIRRAAPADPRAQPEPPDEEKAALIHRVMNLTDQQITALPAEQRRSILILRDQIRQGNLTK